MSLFVERYTVVLLSVENLDMFKRRCTIFSYQAEILKKCIYGSIHSQKFGRRMKNSRLLAEFCNESRFGYIDAKITIFKLCIQNFEEIDEMPQNFVRRCPGKYVSKKVSSKDSVW